MVLTLEKFLREDFPWIVRRAFGVKICLEMPLGALDYMLQLHDKLEEFFIQ